MKRIATVVWLVGLTVSFGVGWYAHSRVDRSTTAVGPALQAALSEGDRFQRIRELTQALNRLDSENIGDALDVYEANLWNLGECEIRPFIDAWARFGAADAADRVSTWSLANKQQIGLEALIQSWALHQPLEARIAMERLVEQNPRLRVKLTENLVLGWTHSGDEGVLKFVEELPLALRNRAIVSMVGAQARRLGTEGLLDWADWALGEVDGRFQKGLFRRVTGVGARRNPERAAAWVETHAGNDYAVDGARLVAEHWLERDPESAEAWLESSSLDEATRQEIRESIDRPRPRAAIHGADAGAHDTPKGRPSDPDGETYSGS